MDAVSLALDALRAGRFVLVYDADGREGETDLAIASEFVTPHTIRTMRKDAGGWICTTVPPDAREKLGLPLLADVLVASAAEYPILRDLVPSSLPYDRRSAFGITASHRDTFTGVTAADRTRTIARVAEPAGGARRRGPGGRKTLCGSANSRVPRGTGDPRGVARMVRVMATGVFDLFHPGHIEYLYEAKKLGDELVVVVARDSTAERFKHRPIVPEAQRVEMVSALKPVDRATLGNEGDIYDILTEVRPDVIAGA